MSTITPSKLVEESLAASGCKRWLAVIGLLDGYVDAEMILLISMLCRKLQSLRWTLSSQNWGQNWLKVQENLPGPRLLSFASFRGYDGSAIVDRYVREVLSLTDLSPTDELVLDLSYCALIKDKDLIELVSNDSPFIPCAGNAGHACSKAGSRTTRKCKNGGRPKYKLVGIKLDYCFSITDQSLAALLSTYLPHLRMVSFKCVRNKEFTGEPFTQILSHNNWPSISYVGLDFTSVTLQSVQAVAQLLSMPHIPRDVPTPVSFSSALPPSSPAAASSPATHEEDLTNAPYVSEHPSTGLSSAALLHSAPPHLTFVGSQASKHFLESIGGKHLISRLQEALNSADPDEIRALRDAAETEALILDDVDALSEHVVDHGASYIMNLPVTCPTSEEGGVNVWTLPISLALLNGDAAFVQALIECGAEIDVVDHLGKSPIYRAVSSGNLEVVEYLVTHGVDLAPLNICGPTALNAAIMTHNYEISRLLIEHGYPLNLKCPGWKGFKSPLHVAAELPDERLLHDLLDWGADPNTYSGTWKNSPIMLAYKAEPRLLRLFIHNLNFKSKPLAAEVLAAAIAKDDLRTVELIVDSLPTLLEREHPTWSYPHIQAAKTGRSAILNHLFRAFTLRIVGVDLKDLRRTFPLCMKHSQEDTNTDLSVAASTIFPNSSPAKVSRVPSKGSVDDSHPQANEARGSTVNPKTKNRFWSKQSTAEAQSFRLLPMESDDAALQHWNEGNNSLTNILSAIATSYNKGNQLPIRYSKFLNAVDMNTGNTALHYAVESGHIDCVKLLLRYGCDVDIKNYHMQTSLHVACQENQLEIVEYLLCTGADFLDITDEDEDTPLVTAIRRRNDRIAITIILFWRMCRKQGVEFVKSVDSQTANSGFIQGPLDVAVEYGRWDVVNHLLKVGTLRDVMSESEERRGTTYSLVQECLQNSSKLPANARKTATKFISLYHVTFHGEPAQEPLTEVDQDDEFGTDWYDLCLLCTTKTLPHRMDTPPNGSNAISHIAQENKESRARRFQSKLRLVARKPLLLFSSNRHKASVEP